MQAIGYRQVVDYLGRETRYPPRWRKPSNWSKSARASLRNGN